MILSNVHGVELVHASYSAGLRSIQPDLRGFAVLALGWLEAAGVVPSAWRQLGAVHAGTLPSGGLVGAALDLLRTIDASPEGRQALLDLLRYDIPEDAERE